MKYLLLLLFSGVLLLVGCKDSGVNEIKNGTEETILIFEGNTLIPHAPNGPFFEEDKKLKGSGLPKINEEQKRALKDIILNYSNKKKTPYVAFIGSKKNKKFKYKYFKLTPDQNSLEESNGEDLFYYILFIDPQTQEAYKIIAARIPYTTNQKQAIKDWAKNLSGRENGWSSNQEGNTQSSNANKAMGMGCSYVEDIIVWDEDLGSYHQYSGWVCTDDEQLDPGDDGGGSGDCQYSGGGCDEEPPSSPGGDSGDDNNTDPCPTGQQQDSNGNCMDITNCETSAQEIGEAFPNASTEAKDKLEQVINQYGEKFGIDNKYELQHFLAQAGHESGGFTDLSITENLNYSVQGLLNTFPYIFSQTDPNKADPDDYAGNPEKIANLVYSGSKAPLGNGSPSSGDGWKYRGRGVFQLTGKYNYQQFTNYAQNDLGLTTDFVQNPGLLSSNSETAIISALWFFKERVLDNFTIDENTSVEKVTAKINAGKLNLIDRESKFEEAQNHINDCKK